MTLKESENTTDGSEPVFGSPKAEHALCCVP